MSACSGPSPEETATGKTRRGKVVHRRTWFAVVEPHDMPTAKNATWKTLGRRIEGWDVVDLGVPILGKKQEHIGRYKTLAEAKEVCDRLDGDRLVYLVEKGSFIE